MGAFRRDDLSFCSWNLNVAFMILLTIAL